MFSYDEISNLTFINATLNAVNDSFSWGPGIRNEYILHYVKKGCGYFECNGKKYRLTKGQCFFIFPNNLIKYYSDKDSPWEYAWINFTGEYCKKLLSATNISIKNPVTDVVDNKILNLIEELGKLNNCFDLVSKCRAVGFLYLCLSYFIDNFPSKSEDRNEDYIIKNTIYIIENNYRKSQLNIEFIANQLNINRSSLYRHFIKYMNLTPNEYLLKIRISKAKQLIKSTDCLIKDIAYSVGFSNNLYFSKVFKLTTGLTPTEYRYKS